MSDGIIKITTASIICDLYYDKLRYLSGSNMQESEEFETLFNKIKHCVEVENEEYHSLSTDDLLSYLINVEENKITNPALSRIYSKLTYELRIREGTVTKNGVLLSDAITTKMLIDVLKRMSQKLEELKYGDIEEEDILMLNIYHNVHKYNYLAANNYIESLALEHRFDIDKMPTLNFTEMEKNYNLNFIEQTKDMILKQTVGTIEEFFNLDNDDQYTLAYVTLFEMTKFECFIEYLGYKEIITLQKYLDSNFNESIEKDTIREIIKKRKKELN